MADYPPADAKRSTNERGYANDSKDWGGETWAGITRRDWPDWEGWKIVDAAKQQLGLTSGRDLPTGVRQMLDEVLRADTRLAQLVSSFFKAKYWDTLQLDQEPSQAIAEKVHDIAVNQGVGTARKFLAQARKDA